MHEVGILMETFAYTPRPLRLKSAGLGRGAAGCSHLHLHPLKCTKMHPIRRSRNFVFYTVVRKKTVEKNQQTCTNTDSTLYWNPDELQLAC